MNELPTEQIVLQRIRNRIIEVLELFSDSDKYKLAISNLEFWADWVNPQKMDGFAQPVFSAEERLEISKVNLAWDQVKIDSSQISKEWSYLSRVSKDALHIFMQRGKLSEDTENP